MPGKSRRGAGKDIVEGSRQLGLDCCGAFYSCAKEPGDIAGRWLGRAASTAARSLKVGTETSQQNGRNRVVATDSPDSLILDTHWIAPVCWGVAAIMWWPPGTGGWFRLTLILAFECLCEDLSACPPGLGVGFRLEVDVT